MRENQEVVVNTYLEHVHKAGFGGGLLELPCAYGKTVLSLNIISQLKKKTFIIVHKEFLMNQWIERIEQFLPGARVGKIQGPIIDIDDKDIVIAMLQSLSMKDYPASVFESFGFTIIDEVHHISSEVFSNSLFKLVTKYMLGLSATMNRKDGTTPVFKMFLGDVIFKSKRDNDRAVTVRGIEYYVDDDDFNEVKLDYRGKPQYSTMISKLCEYNRRSEFILKVLSDMLNENPNQQVMILAHNKNLLKYLHDAVAHRNIATVGYYVGGMKESALKETESKKVVIATYAMAAEALDIKTLTTLIMATPKTDIEQSVGRILREKHSSPIVVDIVDSHDLFKNQWRKRKTFYKKENYKIIYTTSPNYTPNTDLWQVIYKPNNSKMINNFLEIDQIINCKFIQLYKDYEINKFNYLKLYETQTNFNSLETKYGSTIIDSYGIFTRDIKINQLFIDYFYCNYIKNNKNISTDIKKYYENIMVEKINNLKKIIKYCKEIFPKDEYIKFIKDHVLVILLFLIFFLIF